MELIIWRDAFNTGYPRVDVQHKYLVKLINELFDTLGVKNSEPKLIQILNELYAYTKEHFSLEEAIMREYGYKNYNLHKIEHTDFVCRLNDFKGKLKSGDAKINLDLLNFLKDWLMNHILKSDKATFKEIQITSSK
jgi:hemerythrin-like metal-binding protein